MKKIFIIILILCFESVFFLSFPSNYLTCSSSIIAFEPDSLLDGSLFELDDSLLCAEFPEVMVKPRNGHRENSEYSSSIVLQYTPNDTLSGNYLIVTTYSLYDSLNYEIRRYAEDAHTIYGYGINLITASFTQPEHLKSLILDYSTNLKGVFLIGDLGECMYEINDDYKKYGYKKWPCDLYYMDLDGIWNDIDDNGIYDQHTGNVAPDIFLGRLTANGMSTTYGDEISLIRRQLTKSHDFWWKSSFHEADSVLNYVDKDWNYTFLPNTISTVFPDGNVKDVRYGTDSFFSPSDYLNRIATTNYGFTHIAAHSSPTRHHLTTGYIYSSQISCINSYNFAYNLFCCSACNWTLGNNLYLGGAYLFNNGKTITVVGSTKIGSMLGTQTFYSYFPNMHIGNSFLQWWRHYYGSSHSPNCISWSYGMTILGDPIIFLRHNVSDVCENDLVLNSFPSDNHSNMIMYKAGNSITVTGDFIIPSGVHVIFDAPSVVFSNGFQCPIGSSFETRNEGCEL